MDARIKSGHDGLRLVVKQRKQFQIRVHDLAAPCARALQKSSAPQGGRGECRVPAAPAASCAIV